jgi:signal recognition particle subunit SEC65
MLASRPFYFPKEQAVNDLFPEEGRMKDLRDQLRCVNREINMRTKVYPKWVERGSMTQKKADEEIATMKAVRDTLMDLIAPKS